MVENIYKVKQIVKYINYRVKYIIMPKIQEIKSKSGTVFTITIPKSIVKLKGWEKGDTIEFVESNGKICLDNLSKR